MSIVNILMVFFISWWMIFFTMLPVGVKGQHESDEDMVRGTDPGAPVKPELLKKAIRTTIITVVFTAVFWGVAESGWIDFRLMSEKAYS